MTPNKLQREYTAVWFSIEASRRDLPGRRMTTDDYVAAKVRAGNMQSMLAREGVDVAQLQARAREEANRMVGI